MTVPFLKIPQGCYSQCVQLGILNQVEFYYSLKKLSPNGFFENGTLISTIQNDVGYAPSTIWKKVKQLINVNLIMKHKQGYRLVSYDKLFEILQYDLSKNGHRKGDFKIHKIPTAQINDIKSWIALVDIRDNLNVQTHRAYYNLHKDKRYQYTENNLHCANMQKKRQVLNSVAKDTVRMMNLNDDAKTLRQMDELSSKRENCNIYCNPDVTLSLKGICRILGLSNTSSAHRVVQRLKKHKLINVKNRMVRIGSTSIDFETYSKQYADIYIMRDGALWRRLPNKISVGV